MTVTDLIAGYAAIVSTATLGWEVWKARREQRPRFRVELKAVGPRSAGALLRVYNHDGYPMKIDELIMTYDFHWSQPVPRRVPFSSMSQVPVGPPEVAVPLVLPPHDSISLQIPARLLTRASHMTWLEKVRTDDSVIMPGFRLRASVKLATGELVHTRWLSPLSKRSLLQVSDFLDWANAQKANGR
jgi:hypothetical protein